MKNRTALKKKKDLPSEILLGHISKIILCNIWDKFSLYIQPFTIALEWRNILDNIILLSY